MSLSQRLKQDIAHHKTFLFIIMLYSRVPVFDKGWLVSCSNGEINVKALTKNKITSFSLTKVFKGCLLSYLESKKLMIN